ncbi:MAG: hypothetical protein K2K72_06205, partial [Duncaniella sp.]|nr:hypothetical protein [Duncaniella sp.]
YALMPDHLHLLLSVETRLDDILGRKLASFKVLVNQRSGIEQVFEKGFNDQILTTNRDLNVLFTYLRENPHRLAVRRANPDFFTRVNRLSIGDKTYAAYGNLHLLANPFQEQVVIHRADSPEKKERDRLIRIHCAANGGVLVSPFISKGEKDTRTEAESLGGNTILITHEAFGERFKPSAHDFDLCCQGRLLIVSLDLPAGTYLSRELCLAMNSLAQTISSII